MRDLLADLLDTAGDAIESCAGQDEEELLAAVAKRQVLLPNLRAEEGAQRAEHIVAGLVPERIVDALEVIDVDQGEHSFVSPATRSAQLALDEIRQVAAIVEP